MIFGDRGYFAIPDFWKSFCTLKRFKRMVSPEYSSCFVWTMDSVCFVGMLFVGEYVE